MQTRGSEREQSNMSKRSCRESHGDERESLGENTVWGHCHVVALASWLNLARRGNASDGGLSGNISTSCWTTRREGTSCTWSTRAILTLTTPNIWVSRWGLVGFISEPSGLEEMEGNLTPYKSKSPLIPSNSFQHTLFAKEMNKVWLSGRRVWS
jgi:hypothetical protein